MMAVISVLQYGTAPALVVLCVLVAQLRIDLKTISTQLGILETRLRLVEREYVKSSKCDTEAKARTEGVHELTIRLDELKSQFCYLQGSLATFMKGSINGGKFKQEST